MNKKKKSHAQTDHFKEFNSNFFEEFLIGALPPPPTPLYLLGAISPSVSLIDFFAVFYDDKSNDEKIGPFVSKSPFSIPEVRRRHISLQPKAESFASFSELFSELMELKSAQKKTALECIQDKDKVRKTFCPAKPGLP